MLPKIIWCLWLQGWDNAPEIVQACAQSWRRHNPGWEMRCLTRLSIGDYLPASPEREALAAKDLAPETFTELLRVRLLRAHGGVWVDATTYCLRPLDEWIATAAGAGFFAFARPGPDRMISTWFLAAPPRSYIMAALERAMFDYWAGRVATHRYFWLHDLFAERYAHDPVFAAAWDAVPKQSADGPHQFIPYEPRLFEPPSAADRSLIETADLPLLKLTHKIPFHLAGPKSTYRLLCDRMRQVSAPSAVLVLGMHRSGTSCVTGVLGHLGICLGGGLMPSKPDNPKGFFEKQAVMDLHDEILASLGSTWDDPRPLPAGWEYGAGISPYRERLAALIEQEFSGERLWAVKDPRLCRLLPLWRAILAKRGVTIKTLIVMRRPAEVIASMAARNDMPAAQAAMLWLSYMVAAERHSRNMPRAIVIFDDMLADWRRESARIATTLGVEFAVQRDVATTIDRFVDTNLRHHDNAVSQPPAWRPDLLASVEAALHGLRDTGAPPGEICDEAAAALDQIVGDATPVVQYLLEAARREMAGLLRARLQIIESQRADIAMIKSSRSWRATAPLRWLAAWPRYVRTKPAGAPPGKTAPDGA